MPLEDAGGGWHATLVQAAENFQSALAAGGFTVNAMRVDFANKRAFAYVAGHLPDTAATETYSRPAHDLGYDILVVPVWRTEADALKQQARIDHDRDALAKRGIRIGVTAITVDANVRVDVYDGTPEQADYLAATYGPKGLQINIGAVPHPEEASG